MAPYGSVGVSRREVLGGFGWLVTGLGSVVLLGPKDAVAATPWHRLDQGTRNILIVGRGMQDIGKVVGIVCKKWVQRVVKEASKSVVAVPGTTEDSLGCTWYSSPDVKSDIFKTIRRAQFGDIIQIKWRTPNRQPLPPISSGDFWTPHTAIISRVTSSGVTWLDSNYVGINTVGEHIVKFENSPLKCNCRNIRQYAKTPQVQTYHSKGS